MGDYYGLAILMGVTLFLTNGQCNDNCKGQDGVRGTPGRDGRQGAKGEKGEPAVVSQDTVDVGVLLMLKGEAGIRGPQGTMGYKGFPGDLGPKGAPGQPGRPGLDGRGHGQHSGQQSHSAFSVMRTVNSYPAYNKPITYQRAVINKPADFDINTGHFTCRVPGVYYFTFHSMAKVSLCLQIVSDALEPKKLGFCDYNKNNEQVLSGGVVLELIAGQRVWLQSFRDQQTANDARDTQPKQIIFNGFLLFTNA